jgi:acyl-CoA-binding protein
MYSLYKQGERAHRLDATCTELCETATLGNVKTSRPGMWDMLGRAKW